MAEPFRLVVASDIHYAGPAEKARQDYESRAVGNPVLRLALRWYRHYIWLRDPLSHTHMLDRFLGAAPDADLAVVNGDYTCDSAFVGVCDDAAAESARLCFAKLRQRFGDRLAITWGDHELGKFSLLGGAGGLRLASYERLRGEFGLEPLWSRELGPWVLLGVVSTLIALPVYLPEALPEERSRWEELRREHLAAITAACDRLQPDQRLLLFCHDPTALPFLAEEPAVQRVLPQLDTTVIGHLHTPLVLKQSRLLAGMPRITFLGNAVRRFSTALRRARLWKPFRVRLCPSLTGCQLLKDGGFLTAELDPAGRGAARWRFHPLPW
ncbi:MAG: hypothetical protein D6766_05735 [Verrucomicrobia bacterium]|nr:MAG: hypothetical protein D6766_05735 [Verrucomicrobiota bacterium]